MILLVEQIDTQKIHKRNCRLWMHNVNCVVDALVVIITKDNAQ